MESRKQINAIFPGTFDPITFGHLDIIKRASEIFDKVFIIIGKNTNKNNLFTAEERLLLVNAAIKEIPNCNALIHNGLTVEIAKELNAKTIIRGIRAMSDFDYEYQIALVNRDLDKDIQTVFMIPDTKYSYISSTIIRELAIYNKDLTKLVPNVVIEHLKKKFNP